MVRTHFDQAVYVPREDERWLLVEALDEAAADPTGVQDWAEVRQRLWAD